MANSESKKATFNEKLDELLCSKNANNVFLTQEKYRNVGSTCEWTEIRCQQENSCWL